MSLMPLSMPGKDRLAKRGRIPDVGQQHSLDRFSPERDMRKPGGLSQLSTTADGSITRRKALAPLNSAENVTVPTRDPFKKTDKIPGISGSNRSKTKRHDYDVPNSALDIELPKRDPFTKAAKIPGISGNELGKTKRHDHGEMKNVFLDTGFPTKDPFTKAAKIPEILGSEFSTTKRHDHDEVKSVMDTGLPTKDPFTKAAKIPEILGSEFSTTKRHDHEEVKSVMDTGLPTKDPFTKAAKIPAILGSEFSTTKRHDHDKVKNAMDTELPTKDPFRKAAKIPAILGSEFSTTKRHDHEEVKSVMATGLPTKDPFSKAAKIPGISGSENSKTKRHDHEEPKSGLNQKNHSFKVDQTPLQPTGSLSKLSTGTDATLRRRKSLAPIGSETDKDAGETFLKGVKSAVGDIADRNIKHTQGKEIHKELDSRASDNSAVLQSGDSEALSIDEEEFYRQHILAQDKLRKQSNQQQKIKELQSQDVHTAVNKGTVGKSSKKNKKKEKKKDKKETEKKKVASGVWPNMSRGHKFEDLPYFRQIRMRYPEYPYNGLPHWAKYFPTPPGFEKMPIPEMYRGGTMPYDMAGYEGMYGEGGPPYGGLEGMYGSGGLPYGGDEGMQYGGNAGFMHQGM